MTEIPANYVFNKGVTGCGATTLAIKQPGNTILAMPFVGLVDNKTASNPEVLGIHGKMKQEEEIIKYLESHDTYKIATTYNSFPVVCKVLKEQGMNPYEEFFLFVDEWHVLLQSYEFRYDAITALLDEARYFKNRTYVSATPIPREY